ncbi:2-octaprenyl-6-methoxyphenyl hydroxylase [Novilysobacter antarcticus]|uniref:2-octaprenyl-6-methoxyphenyl hydroxylase n=1 Tax=Novilysobacter antarcticus TaxID=2862543 RepID=UPI001C98F525|nr:2-octaprenyl-6-methoxyphenyl hydroxylase [Lysobacter antarcticus]
MAASSRSLESAPLPGDAADSSGDVAVATSSEPVIHDVLIIGGGLVGSSLAIALEPLGLNVGLVEAVAPGPSDASVFDQRNLSFAEATVNALTALRVMQKLASPGGAIKRIHVSRRGDFGRSVLKAGDHGRSEFGRVVVARDFGDALEKRLADLERLHRYRPARFLGFADTPNSDCRAVKLADADGERTVLARLVVGADGTRSAVRAALGIGTNEHDYRQTLFVTRLRTDRAPDGTAFERLGDDGPTALLPRGDRHYGLVHAVAREEAEAVAALDEAGFLRRVQEAFGWRAGRFLSCGPRVAYPLVRVLADRLVAERAVLVGNAAQTIHPLGAQGFNLGLRDALTLAEKISASGDGSAHVDCGDADLLSAYVTARADDRRRTLAFSDGLARLTANPAELLRPLRSIGLLAIDRVPSLQAEVVAGALGYRANVPALCRPEGMRP